MKRTLFGKKLKQTFLAVPAAALMLGVSQAQTTVGLNFQAWYYDSGTTPQTIGYGFGYQTTGFPVTATAFGIAPANWSNTDPLDCQSPISTTVTFGGTLSAHLTAPNAWQSGIGEQVDGFNPQTVAPGNNEATWGYLDDGGGNVTNNVPAVAISGLAAKFPHGYVIQTIAAEANVATFAGVDFTDGVTTNSVDYATYYIANPVNDGTDLGGTVGLSAPSGTFTNDSFNIFCHLKVSPQRSTLAGFIITDQPVVTKPPVGGSYIIGSPVTLSAGIIGIPTFGYQWRFYGTNLPGATGTNYFIPGISPANVGNYDLVVTNLYGSATSSVATLTLANGQIQLVTGGIIKDSKPVGTLHPGLNFGTQWLSSSTDFNNLTRAGVEQFVATNKTQIAIPADSDFNTTNGTISFWMQYNYPGGFAGSGHESSMLFDRRVGGTNGTIIAVNANGYIQFQAASGARFAGSKYVVDGNWHNVAVTYDQTAGSNVAIYVDGVLDTSLTNTGTWVWPTNQQIELGHSHDAYWYSYDGQLDDFRTYNRILTPAEIGVIGIAATSDMLVDTSALKVRYNFDSSSAFFGNSLVWTNFTVVSSPTLGAGAVWTPVPNAISPLPILFTSPSMFYRLSGSQ